MKTRTTLFMALTVWFAGSTLAQQTRPKNNDVSTDLLKKFDTNRDGKIDDTERQAVREKRRQMRTKPGAMTPSGKTETIGNREVTEMEYASSDGRKIPCVLSMPKGNGPFPVLVTIHGGQGNRDLGYIRTMAAPNQLSPTVAAFNEQPWAILAISYRAGNGALFGMEQDDVVAGIRFAKTLPKIDPARVGVIGGSHGGHLALVAAEKMGKEFLCVAVGSPWKTDPVVYMTGNPDRPPLSLVPAKACEEIVKNGQRLFQGLTFGRGMSPQQARAFIAQHSIEANADKIVVPSLFITSRGDDQAPHVLIEPMINRMKTAGKDVTVYTAEKSPHGFYWARTVSAARARWGSKSPEELAEETAAREHIIAFFQKQFARTDLPSSASSTGAVTKTQPVRIDSGLLVGQAKGDVRIFRGIPYAAPPVGELRWKAPQPPQPWKGVREALGFGAPALQGETFYPRSAQSEDCLCLNVWTPSKVQPGERLPVLFWIHGGAFIQGSGAQPRYDGTELARRGVVVVTINYRLGPLGLFVHPTLTAEAAPGDPLGNYCLLDMMEALRWVNRNIGAFRFQLQLANNMIRDGQTVYLFQLTFVPPQARASRHAAMHGESVAYSFGTIGQSVAAQYGFRNQQVAAKAMQSRRGTGGTVLGAENEDANPVEDSQEVRRISEAMIDYCAAFLRTGKPHAKNLPEWPAFSSSAPTAMVFGNSGIESKGFCIP